VLGIAVATALLAWFLHAQFQDHPFNWRLFLDSLTGIRWGWIGLATLLLYGTYYGRALRWAVLIRPVKPAPSMMNLLRATVIGFAAITLFGRPGEIVRPYLIANREGVSLTSQLAAWVLERIYDLLMALLVFGYALAEAKSSGMRVGPSLVWVFQTGGVLVAVISSILVILLLAFRHFGEWAKARLHSALEFLPEPHYGRATRVVTSFLQGVESTRSDAALFALFGLSVIEWVLIAGCYWCVAQGFSHQIRLGLVDILIYMGFVSFGAIVQIPGIGGGTQVVSILVLTELFDVGLEVAAGFSLFIWFITFVVIVPVGLLVALHEGLNWRGLRQIGRENVT
jgi:glycosyltransferase 2 family protein